MEIYSSKNLTKGLATIKSSVIEIPKKRFCHGDVETFVSSYSYQVGYYVGNCFHCSRHVDNLSDAREICDDLTVVYPDRKYFVIAVEIYCYRP